MSLHGQIPQKCFEIKVRLVYVLWRKETIKCPAQYLVGYFHNGPVWTARNSYRTEEKDTAIKTSK